MNNNKIIFDVQSGNNQHFIIWGGQLRILAKKKFRDGMALGLLVEAADDVYVRYPSGDMVACPLALLTTKCVAYLDERNSWCIRKQEEKGAGIKGILCGVALGTNFAWLEKRIVFKSPFNSLIKEVETAEDFAPSIPTRYTVKEPAIKTIVVGYDHVATERARAEAAAEVAEAARKAAWQQKHQPQVAA